MRRYWQIEDRLITSLQFKEAGVSPLRGVDLGRCRSLAEARARIPDREYVAATVIAHNVRIVCDSGRGARVGLSRAQIELLRAGQPLTVQDELGEFVCRYSRQDREVRS